MSMGHGRLVLFGRLGDVMNVRAGEPTGRYMRRGGSRDGGARARVLAAGRAGPARRASAASAVPMPMRRIRLAPRRAIHEFPIDHHQNY